MKQLLKENGLSLVWFGLFIVTLFIGQAKTGQFAYNEDQRDHHQREVSLAEYLGTPHFAEATLENWESEFLQMFLFVFLSIFLYQKGSAESKDPDQEEEVDRDPRSSKHKSKAPWPVRKGGLWLLLYENSLGAAFFLLFILCFVLHAISGAAHYNEEQLEHGGVALTSLEYLSTAQFWFESFQNWQSEFLAVGSMVVLSIFLRQKGSPESKPVDSPHHETGKA